MMKREMSVKRCREEVASCNSCLARNYTYKGDMDGMRTDAVLFEVRIGCMVNRLCESCLKELIGAAVVELAKGE